LPLSGSGWADGVGLAALADGDPADVPCQVAVPPSPQPASARSPASVTDIADTSLLRIRRW
jgi:hypothetical protein